MSSKTVLRVDMWSDFMCPFCYIGKRKFEIALRELGFTLQDAPIGSATSESDNNNNNKVALIRYRAFELDPNSQKENPESIATHLSRKYGMPEAAAIANLEGMRKEAAKPGVDLDFNYKNIKIVNTFDAHRLLHFAQESVGKQIASPSQNQKNYASAVKERFLKAYFTDGLSLSNEKTLQELLVKDCGLDAAEVASVIADKTRYAKEVREDEAQARAMRINGVPYFWLNGSVGISGAQDPQAMKATILKALGN